MVSLINGAVLLSYSFGRKYIAFPSQTPYNKNFQTDKGPALNIKINKTLGKYLVNYLYSLWVI